MSLLVELLVEGVLTFLVEILGEVGIALLRTRWGRLVASAVGGFLGGASWTAHLRGNGVETLPKTLWVGLGLAVVGLVAGYALRSAARSTGNDPEVAFGGHFPWRWSPRQWDTFALLNVAVAVGVYVAYTSYTPY